MGYSLLSSNGYQPGSFLDPGTCNLHCLRDRLRGDDGCTALPDLGFNLITALRRKV